MLTDTDLDDLLTSSAPPIAQRSRELHDALVSLAAEAEPTTRPTRVTRPFAAAVAVAVVMGVGGAATAAGLMPAWTPWSTSTGATCGFDYDVSPGAATSDDQAVEEANSYLAEYDFAEIDVPAAIKKWQTVQSRIAESIPTDQRQSARPAEGDQLEIVAVNALVSQQLSAHLDAAGYNPDAVVVVFHTTCGG